MVDSRSICGLPPDEVAKLGIARTFQDLHLVRLASVLENVMLCCRCNPSESLGNLFLRPLFSAAGERRLRGRCLDVLAQVGLADRAHVRAGSLSYGHRRFCPSHAAWQARHR